MDRQIYRLKRANLVIGTPGRVMDHMRRGTLSLSNVRLVVLDEADEMLSMGFREDIETILKDVPEAHQTVLFSATMPDAILELTSQFMRDPQLIEINAAQVTLDAITQQYMEVPMGRKLDALNLLLRSEEPVRTMIFCNTKLMVDEVSAYLNKSGFTCEGIALRSANVTNNEKSRTQMYLFHIGELVSLCPSRLTLFFSSPRVPASANRNP